MSREAHIWVCEELRGESSPRLLHSLIRGRIPTPSSSQVAIMIVDSIDSIRNIKFESAAVVPLRTRFSFAPQIGLEYMPHASW